MDAEYGGFIVGATRLLLQHIQGSPGGIFDRQKSKSGSVGHGLCNLDGTALARNLAEIDTRLTVSSGGHRCLERGQQDCASEAESRLKFSRSDHGYTS